MSDMAVQYVLNTRILRRFLSFVLMSALWVCGCAQKVSESYSDFLINEDVVERFEVCFADVERGHAGLYTVGELRTLVKDLEYGYKTGDEDAAQATELFQQAARTLADAIEEDASGTGPLYEKARELFDEAFRISLIVREGSYSD